MNNAEWFAWGVAAGGLIFAGAAIVFARVSIWIITKLDDNDKDPHS